MASVEVERKNINGLKISRRDFLEGVVVGGLSCAVLINFLEEALKGFNNEPLPIAVFNGQITFPNFIPLMLKPDVMSPYTDLLRVEKLNGEAVHPNKQICVEYPYVILDEKDSNNPYWVSLEGKLKFAEGEKTKMLYANTGVAKKELYGNEIFYVFDLKMFDTDEGLDKFRLMNVRYINTKSGEIIPNKKIGKVKNVPVSKDFPTPELKPEPFPKYREL